MLKDLDLEDIGGRTLVVRPHFLLLEAHAIKRLRRQAVAQEAEAPPQAAGDAEPPLRAAAADQGQRVLAQAQRREEALAAIDQALKISPESAEALQAAAALKAAH